jgi:hypothetical protein
MFKKLPEWIQKKVNRSPAYTEPVDETLSDSAGNRDFDDDIPF